MALIYPLANFGSLAHFGLIGSSAHLLLWPHLLIGSLARWLIGLFAPFLAFLELYCSGLRFIGSLALLCSLAHLLICSSFRPHWLICSMAPWLIGLFVPFLAFGLFWRLPFLAFVPFLAFWPFLAFLELFCSSLRTLGSQGYLTSNC